MTTALPEGFFLPPPDPEIAAIAACVRALLPLDAPARRRVVEYLEDRISCEAHVKAEAAP